MSDIVKKCLDTVSDRIARCLAVAAVGTVILVVFVGVSLLVTTIGQVAWNYTLPALFGVPSITFWRMFALIVLGRILFGSVKIDIKSG